MPHHLKQNSKSNNIADEPLISNMTKPVLHIYRRYLLFAWYAWIMLRLFVMPLVMRQVTQTSNTDTLSIIGFFAWQVLILLPMLFLTVVVYQAKNAHALILTSLVLMVYWAVSASHLLIACYQKQYVLAFVYGVENVLLAVMFFMLFLFTKKMPPAKEGFKHQ